MNDINSFADNSPFKNLIDINHVQQACQMVP
jgi:hypothetical protein